MTNQHIFRILLGLLVCATGARGEIVVDDFSDAATPSVYPYVATLGMTSGLVFDAPVDSAIGGSRLQALFATLTDPPRQPTPLDRATVDIDTPQGRINISGSENLGFSWNIAWEDSADTSTLDLDLTAESAFSFRYGANVDLIARIFLSNAGPDGVSIAANIVEITLPSSPTMQTRLVDLADINQPVFGSPGSPLPDVDPTSVDVIVMELATVEENASVSLGRVAFVPEPQLAFLLWYWLPLWGGNRRRFTQILDVI